eukprot:4066425-Ditylum_brightwellii.AAC.1
MSEGYKFFTIMTMNGFVVNFTPDQRTAAKTGKQEYSRNSTGGKIESMKDMLDKVATRASHTGKDVDVKIGKFCLAMDNYFTLPQVVKHLKDNDIGIVGTTRMRKRWPPPAWQKIQQKDCNFNEIRYLIDDNRALV